MYGGFNNYQVHRIFSVFPAPCSLFPVPCSLFPKTKEFVPD
ncbi:hypothetical protein BJP36_38695 [Moorena producens JHB]|uniref:Uncharacterized protein n=1 Tax=Moorena producens (strain JHB) TaxID=1454205 RepID=A0A9Q9SUQ5_MOOP1|nr:hypothetical protein [Moorena producens]WAN70003.1 hypothetical protein BJP36_38695 [Moorena producens JHB]